MPTKNNNRVKSAKAVKVNKPKLKFDGLKVKTTGRTISSGVAILVLSCLLVGVLVGVFCFQKLTENDCFEMVMVDGQTDIEIGGEGNPNTYQELGVKCVAFGQDVVNSVKIRYLYREDITHDVQEVDTINPSVDGIYYVVYTSTNIKYQTVQLVRNVIVLRVED